LAVLNLLTAVAAAMPLVCLIDDAQWLDDTSAQSLPFVGRRLLASGIWLAFVGRRLLAEGIVLLFAVREEGEEHLFPDLPTWTLAGLTDDDARTLLQETVPGRLDERVRERAVAE